MLSRALNRSNRQVAHSVPAVFDDDYRPLLECHCIGGQHGFESLLNEGCSRIVQSKEDDTDNICTGKGQDFAKV